MLINIYTFIYIHVHIHIIHAETLVIPNYLDSSDSVSKRKHMAEYTALAFDIFRYSILVVCKLGYCISEVFFLQCVSDSQCQQPSG